MIDVSIIGKIWRTIRRPLPYVLLAILAICFRLPAFVNAADDINSDSAIVVLQAMHVLRGDVTWYLWGTDYQSSFETILLAPILAIFGARPVVVVAFSVASHIAIMWFVYAILRRHSRAAMAFCVTLTLAWTTWPAISPSVTPPRGWSIALYFAGIYLLDGAARSKRPLLNYALGAALPIAAVYLDLFTLQMLPAAIVFAFLTTKDDVRGGTVFVRAIAVVIGAGIMSAIYIWLRTKTTPSHQDLDAANISKVFPHFWNESLPATVGLKVYQPGANLYPDAWLAPRWFVRVEQLGALSMLIGYAVANLTFAWAKIPWRARRLGMLAFLVAGASICGFNLNGKVGDMWAMRYLAPLTWMFPFALAPMASRLKVRTLVLFLTPYLASTMVGGWLSYGHWVNGAAIVQTARGKGDDERWLGEALRLRGIHQASAQYWLSYRLTFLWHEDPVVVPFGADRYAPYRHGFDAARDVAYIFHPSEPRSKASDFEQGLKDRNVPFDRQVIAGFTVITLHDGLR